MFRKKKFLRISTSKTFRGKKFSRICGTEFCEFVNWPILEDHNNKKTVFNIYFILIFIYCIFLFHFRNIITFLKYEKKVYTNLTFSIFFSREEIFANCISRNISREDIFANLSKNSRNFANSRKLLSAKITSLKVF